MERRLLILATALAVLAAGPARALTLRVPADAPDLAAALAGVAAGDTVTIAPGTYLATDIVLVDGIVLRGDPENPGNVVLDAFYGGRILECVDFQHPTAIEGITFTRGVSPTAAAVLCESSTLAVRRCVFVGNLSGDDGGAMVCVDSDVVIEDCRFEGNESSLGSGGALTSRRSDPVLRRCVFIDNRAYGYGGAFYYSAVDQSPRLEKCVFTGNEGGLGGAFAANGSTASLASCDFSANTARNQGGAFYVGFGADVLFDDCRFDADVAPDGKTGVVGGGSRAELHCCDADPSLITGGGLVVWNEEGCDQVGAEALSLGRVKALFR